MRSKEDAQDYRYFPDPDLPPLVIGDEWIERVRAALPELPRTMQQRYAAEYALPASDAATLTASRGLAAYFEDVVRTLGGGAANAKLAANWIQGDVAAALNRAEISIERVPVPAATLARLLSRIVDQTISGKIAKDVFDAAWRGEHGGDPDAIVAAKGLTQISDEDALGRIIDDVLAANASMVAEFKAGKEKAFNALIGQAMKATRGKANPAQVNAILKRKLGR